MFIVFRYIAIIINLIMNSVYCPSSPTPHPQKKELVH